MATKKEREETKANRRLARAELEAEWDRRLAPLQASDAAKRVQGVMAAKGRATRRSKAGQSF